MTSLRKQLPKAIFRRHRRQGFSLIEIGIAISILAMAILPIIGILSVGVSASGDTMKNIVVSRILNQVDAQIRQTSFKDLQTNSDGLYFDDEGVSTNSSDALWKATWTVVPSASLPSAQGGDFGDLSTAKLVKVVTCFVPNGTAVASRTQTNFLYVNDRGQ
jgi:uncharacterized protein (TIGR02598 family)